jgi:hypothetical protein
MCTLYTVAYALTEIILPQVKADGTPFNSTYTVDASYALSKYLNAWTLQCYDIY